MKSKNNQIKYSYNNKIHDCLLVYITSNTIKIRVNQIFIENDLVGIGLKNNYEMNNWYWLKCKVVSVENQLVTLMLLKLYDEDDIFIDNYIKSLF